MPAPQHYVSFRGVKALKSTHPHVRRLKRRGYIASHHGNKVWRSSFVLMDYLAKRDFPEGVRVLDVGCGWGLSGIFMAKKFGAEVTGLDIDTNVEPFLELQASLNNCRIEFLARSLNKMTIKDLSAHDVIVGADICFWDEMADNLYRFINRAVKGGVSLITIADPGRPPFWELSEKCGEKFVADTFSRTIKTPWETTKQLLVVEP